MTGDNSNGQSLRYAGEARGAAFDQWREEFGRQVVAVDLQPLGEGPVDRSVTQATLPRMVLASATGSPIQTSTTRPREHFALHLPRDSQLELTMASRPVAVVPPSLCLSDMMVRNSISQHADGRHDVICIDQDALLERLPKVSDRLSAPVVGETPLIRLLDSYFELVLRVTPTADAETLNAMSRHLLDLVVLALGAGRDEREAAIAGGLSEARYQAIVADIRTRLPQQELQLSTLARVHRVSPRYIQSLFERRGQSFSSFVQEQRLQLALRLLEDPAVDRRKVSTVADMSGFGDLSHFHRTFRRRFGMTPADARATLRRA